MSPGQPLNKSRIFHRFKGLSDSYVHPVGAGLFFSILKPMEEILI